MDKETSRIRTCRKRHRNNNRVKETFRMIFGDCEFCKHMPRCGDMRIISRKIEQKIKDRIAFLERWKYDPHSAIAGRIDELRKLLE